MQTALLCAREQGGGGAGALRACGEEGKAERGSTSWHLLKLCKNFAWNLSRRREEREGGKGEEK